MTRRPPRRKGISTGVRTLTAALLTTFLVCGFAVSADAAAPAVSTSTPTIVQGKTLTIAFDAQGAPHTTDWIGIYASGVIQSRCPSPATYWGYTSSGTQSAGSKAVDTGSLAFDTTTWLPGTYSVYFCQNDGYTTTGTPITVTVTTAPSSTPTPTPGLTWPTLPAGFITDTLRLPTTGVNVSVRQHLAGIWNGLAPTSYSKVGGDNWLAVDQNGTISGTTPATAPNESGEITVSATNGTVTSQILIEVPVAKDPDVRAVTWNAWDDGSHVDDAVGKNLAAVATRGIGILAFQDGGAEMAAQIATALGWNVETSGDLGIVSRYPFTGDETKTAAAFGTTVKANGRQLRVWDAYVDEDSPSSTPVSRVESAVAQDVQHSDIMPVLVLADLGTEANVATLTNNGLTDLYRLKNPTGGATWPVFPSSAGTATRIDVALAAGTSMHLIDSDQLRVGWPSANTVTANSWASNHAAVTATFSLSDTPQPSASPSAKASGPGTGHRSSSGSTKLASTGSDLSTSLIAGGILLALGIALTAATWNRNRRRINDR